MSFEPAMHREDEIAIDASADESTLLAHLMTDEIDEDEPEAALTPEDLSDPSLPKASNIVIVNGIKLHDRSDEDYDKIWATFLLMEPEFKDLFGYGEAEIREAGIRKFIDAMDWTSPSDVEKFRTDSYHVTLCPQCHSDFGIYEENMGLCRSCVPLFDMEKFWSQYRMLLKSDDERVPPQSLAALFWSFQDFRDLYKKQ